MAGQQIQQARTLADRGVSQPLIPFAQQDLHFVANRGQLVKLPLESVQALTDQGAHTLAGRDPSVPLAENRRQFLERESDDQRALNEADPFDGRWRIASIARIRARGAGQQSEPLVVPKRVGADASRCGQRTRADPRLSQWRGRTSALSPVWCSRIWYARNSWTALSAALSPVTMFTRPPVGVST